MTRRELLAAAGALGLVLAATLGSYVLNGGFLMDDWTNAAIARFADGPLDMVRDYRADGMPSSNHVGLCVAFALQFGILGDHYTLQLAALAGTAWLMGLAFFAVLRALRVPALHAGVLAVLVVLFPVATSARLWATLAPNNVAVALWLGGVLAALRGGRRWHALALALYAASILLYELTAAAVALSVVLYAVAGVERRALLGRWAADLAVTAASLGVFLAVVGRSSTGSLDDKLDHLGEIVTQVPDVLATALWPFGGLPSGVALALLAAVAALGVARRDRRGLTVLGLGGLGLVAGYVLFVPAEDFYVPLYAGHGNRVNLVASLGFVTILYGMAIVLAAARREAAYAVAAAALVIGVGYAVETRDDAGTWARAFALEQRTLAQLGRTVPDPPSGVTVYVTGQQGGRVAENVPVFDWRFDLTGAVKLLWDDPAVAGYPILQGTRLVCEDGGLHPEGNGLDVNHGARYGFAILADVASGRRTGIDDRAECEREAARLRPAPLYVTD